MLYFDILVNCLLSASSYINYYDTFPPLSTVLPRSKASPLACCSLLTRNALLRPADSRILKQVRFPEDSSETNETLLCHFL